MALQPASEVSIPIAEPSQEQIDAKAFETLRLLDGLACSTIEAVFDRAALFLRATVRLDCAATDFVQAEQGFAGAPAQPGPRLPECSDPCSRCPSAAARPQSPSPT